MADTIDEFSGGPYGAAEIQAVVEQIWADVKAHPGELPPGMQVDLNGVPPLIVQQMSGQVDFISVLIVGVVGGIGKEAGATLWKKLFWPELLRRLKGLPDRT